MNIADIGCSIMCRACMKVDGVLLPMYGDDMISKKNLPDKLADLASIQIDKYDGLPSVLCAKCAYRTDAFHEFKLQVQSTEKKLRKMFQCSNIQNISLKAEQNDYESDNRCSASWQENLETVSNASLKESETNCKEKEESDVKPRLEDDSCEDEVCIVDSGENQSSNNFPDEIEENASELSTLPNLDHIFISGINDMIEVRQSEIQTIKHEVSDNIENILQSDNLSYTLLYIPAEDEIELDSDEAQQVINLDDDTPENEEFSCNDNEEDNCEDKEYSQISWNADDSRNENEETTVNGKSDVDDLPNVIIASDYESEETPEDLKNNDNLNNLLKETTNDDSDSDYFVDPQIDVLGSINDTIMRIKEIKINGELNYQCTLCVQNYDKLTGVLIHTVENHVPSSGPFFCVVCEKDCESHRKLRSHVKTHSGKFPYTCFICNKAYSMKRYLKRHMSCHTDLPRHRCPKCGTRFSVKSELEIHVRSHIDGGAQFACNQCQRVFNHKGNYKRHLISHLDPRGIHLPKYPCEVCGKRFLNNRNLKTHIRVHTGEKPFECDICKRAFSQQGNLLNHLRLHLNPRSYTCEVCGKRFNQRATLREHSLLHTGEKPYVCNVCGLAFTFSAALRRHMWTHTHDKPFGCEICNARFVGKYDMKRHMKIHTKKSNNKRKRNNQRKNDLPITENSINDINDDTDNVVGDSQTIFIEHQVLIAQDSTDITPQEEAEKENVDALFNLIQYG